MLKTQHIEISKLKQNTGQIKGLPANPRTIKDESFEALKKSIKDDPEMMELREIIVYPLKDIFVVIGGNKRFSASKDLKFKKVPCKILPKTTSVKKLQAITIKDFEALRADWDEEQLSEWGLDIPQIEEEEEEGEPKQPETGVFFLNIKMDNEEHCQDWYNKLINEGLDVKIVT
jgi:ParB-like chromosome segregation protein Spo0J